MILTSLILFSCTNSSDDGVSKKECRKLLLLGYAQYNVNCSDPNFRKQYNYIDYNSCIQFEMALFSANCIPGV